MNKFHVLSDSWFDLIETNNWLLQQAQKDENKHIKNGLIRSIMSNCCIIIEGVSRLSAMSLIKIKFKDEVKTINKKINELNKTSDWSKVISLLNNLIKDKIDIHEKIWTVQKLVDSNWDSSFDNESSSSIYENIEILMKLRHLLLHGNEMNYDLDFNTGAHNFKFEKEYEVKEDKNEVNKLRINDNKFIKNPYQDIFDYLKEKKRLIEGDFERNHETISFMKIEIAIFFLENTLEFYNQLNLTYRYFPKDDNAGLEGIFGREMNEIIAYSQY
jgi:hypothetical protein